MSLPENYDFWLERPADHGRHDWGDQYDSWLDGYWESRKHPHRDLLMRCLAPLNFGSVFEAGCNVGPNLFRIQEEYGAEVGGIDANPEAIKRARFYLPRAKLLIGSIIGIPVEDKSYDLVLSDAALMYIPPEEIREVLAGLDRIARKYIVLTEWHSESLLGETKYFHWARDYKKLLEELDYDVEEVKIPRGIWPTKSGNWEKIGRIYIAKKL